MSEQDNTPDITMVPVTKHEVVLSLDDLLDPLTRTAENLNRAGLGRVNDPEVAEQLQEFTQLVTQLKEVGTRINVMDPDLLASKRGLPPT